MVWSPTDLHGQVPDNAATALLLVDIINALEFPGGDVFTEPALRTGRAISALIGRCDEHSIPVIYANDTFGRWRSDSRKIVEAVTERACPGQELARMLRPRERDYFVLKPKHSAFFSTILDVLLRHLGVGTVILGGLQTHICVLLTACDAYMRDMKLCVPRDCVVAQDPDVHEAALLVMETSLKADIRPAVQLDLAALNAQEDS
jgi:nicotinamidase-related amidase